MVGGHCPKNLDAIYICHSSGIHYDIVLDVSARTSDSSQHNSSNDSKINYFGSGDIFLPEYSFQNYTDEVQSESHKHFTNFRPIKVALYSFLKFWVYYATFGLAKFTTNTLKTRQSDNFKETHDVLNYLCVKNITQF